MYYVAIREAHPNAQPAWFWNEPNANWTRDFDLATRYTTDTLAHQSEPMKRGIGLVWQEEIPITHEQPGILVTRAQAERALMDAIAKTPGARFEIRTRKVITYQVVQVVAG
jgi:hypothetical protein